MRTILLGSLAAGRTFWYNGRKYKVVKNMAGCGVDVMSLATRQVKIKGREFTATERVRQLWSLASEVEVR